MTKNKFRLPEFGVGIGIGPKTIFLSDRIFEQLQISEKLGTSSGKAILNDPFGGKHEGYNYLSFIHPLPLKRAEKRLHRIPLDKRPFIFLKPSKHKEVIFIHKNLITLWTQLACTGIIPNYHDTYSKYKGWDYLYINMDYASLKDWQTNNYTIYKSDTSD